MGCVFLPWHNKPKQNIITGILRQPKNNMRTSDTLRHKWYIYMKGLRLMTQGRNKVLKREKGGFFHKFSQGKLYCQVSCKETCLLADMFYYPGILKCTLKLEVLLNFLLCQLLNILFTLFVLPSLPFLQLLSMLVTWLPGWKSLFPPSIQSGQFSSHTFTYSPISSLLLQ